MDMHNSFYWIVSHFLSRICFPLSFFLKSVQISRTCSLMCSCKHCGIFFLPSILSFLLWTKIQLLVFIHIVFIAIFSSKGFTDFFVEWKRSWILYKRNIFRVLIGIVQRNSLGVWPPSPLLRLFPIILTNSHQAKHDHILNRFYILRVRL